MSAPAGRPPLRDAAARARAATIFDRNLVVTAGAGTGKTALLVERALNLLGSGRASIDQITAITFTEKAAAEMRERLATGLDLLRELAAREEAPGSPDDASEARRSYAWLRLHARIASSVIEDRARSALAALDAASVTTIHAFCAEILRRHPAEAHVDPAFVVDEGPGFDEIFDHVWEEFLIDELRADAPRREIWEKALLHPDALGLLRDLGRSLAGFGIPSSAAAPGARYAAAPALDLLGDEMKGARDAAFGILSRSIGMNGNMTDFLSASARLLDACLDGGPESMSIVTSPLSLADYVDKGVPAPGKRLQGAGPEEVTEAARRAQSLIRRLARVDESAIAALVQAAIPLAARSRESLLASGLVSFDALLRLVRDLLAASPGIRREIGSRFRAILVDEFQDTDPLQYEILFFIAEEEGPASSDAYAASLAPGRLFIVGDPKQSIYRFRGADMDAYQRAVRRVIECGGEAVTLTSSFRSPSEIVDPINRIFGGLIGPASPGDEAFEPPYDPIDSARGPSGSLLPRVEIWSIRRDGGAEERRRGEAEAIASWIAEKVSSEDATGRPLRCRDVAILLRALTSAGLYAQALRRAGIPFVVEGGKGFYERPEVGDLIAFLRAAANPNDAPSVLAVMRSPLGAVEDAELARFAASGGRLDDPSPEKADPDRFPAVHRTLDRLAAFRARMVGRSPDDVIRSVLEETPLALLHASSWEGAQRVANLRKIVARAQDLARRGLSLEETVRYIEKEFASERAEGESPLADETVDAVRILSVHKAKGLEYPVVLVPDIGREGGHRSLPETEARWVRAGGDGFLAVKLESGETNIAWAHLEEADRRHDLAEEKRVFYVACTRTKERLILVNSSPGRRAPWREALASIGYEVNGAFPPDQPLAEGAILHRLMEPSEPARPTPSPQIDPIWAQSAARFEEVVAQIASRVVSPLRRASGEHEDRRARETDSDDRDEAIAPAGSRSGFPRDVARLAGTTVHRSLQRWEDLRDGDRLRRLVRDEAIRASERETPPGPEADLLVREVGEEAASIVEAFLGSGLPALLSRLEILGREIPVLHQDAGGTAWTGYCDLVYRDGDGTIVVADYKTDRLDPAEAARAAESYRFQITTYVESIRRAMPGVPVRGEVIFVRTGQAVRLVPASSLSP